MGEQISEGFEVKKTSLELSIEMAQAVLHSMGLYDASHDSYPVTEHDDESWVLNPYA